jgi:hypothetical protein
VTAVRVVIAEYSSARLAGVSSYAEQHVRHTLHPIGGVVDIACRREELVVADEDRLAGLEVHGQDVPHVVERDRPESRAGTQRST